MNAIINYGNKLNHFNISQSILKTIFESDPLENYSAVLAWLVFGTRLKGGVIKYYNIYQFFRCVKFESNITVKNVLQIYVTTTTIFYAISS